MEGIALTRRGIEDLVLGSMILVIAHGFLIWVYGISLVNLNPSDDRANLRPVSKVSCILIQLVLLLP